MIRYGKANTSQGFTIVELVIVIVVIAILAAISVVGYGAWRESIAASEVDSDINGVTAAMENARTWSDDGYPEFADDTVFDGSNGTGDVFTSSENVTLTYKYGDTESYCVEAVSDANSSIIVFFKMENGLKSSGSGECPAP